MSDIGHKLHRETEAAKALRANLADIIGEDGDGAWMAAAVEGQTELNEVIDRAVQQLVEDKAALDGIQTMVDILTSRQDRIKNRVQTMRTALTVAMEQAGKKKIEHPAVTLSLRPVAPSVVITDEALIPYKFFTAGEPKLSKKAVGEALKAKTEVPGATMSNGGTCIALSWS